MSYLSLMETVLETLRRGGWVLFPIFLCGWFAWFLVLYRFMILQRHRVSYGKFWKLISGGKKETALGIVPSGSLFYQMIGVIQKSSSQKQQHIRHSLEETRCALDLELRGGLRSIARLASIAPLLGLLGTVSGMVHTFDTITQFGFGNPVLLADGISEALLTTQAGLVVAFPAVMAHSRLRSMSLRIERSSWANALRFARQVQRGNL